MPTNDSLSVMISCPFERHNHSPPASNSRPEARARLDIVKDADDSSPIDVAFVSLMSRL